MTKELGERCKNLFSRTFCLDQDISYEQEDSIIAFLESEIALCREETINECIEAIPNNICDNFEKVQASYHKPMEKNIDDYILRLLTSLKSE